MTAPTDTRTEPKVLPMSDNPYEDFRYFYRDGMDLRPSPKRRVDKPGWSTLRHNIFDHWHTVHDEWEGYDTPQTRLLDDHMWQTDEQGAALAESFRRDGAKESRAKFEQALNEGIETVEDPSPELVAFFEQVDNIPDWIDLEAAERGRVAYYNATPGADLLTFNFGYWATTMEDRTSAATGETGMFEFKAMQRALETSKFFVDLGKQDVFDRFGEGRKSAVHVRLLHAQANRGLEKLWGEEHYNEFGRPIGSSFLVSGEGWFALMPLAIDELFGRPHSGQDWDDVAQYWAYVLYMMGGEERIIPKTGDEMRKMTDFIYANGGRSSSYHQRVATALMSIVEQMNPDLPLEMLGSLATLVGEEDTKFMVEGTRWADMDFSQAVKDFEAKARAEAEEAREADEKPGAEEYKKHNAAQGRPLWINALEEVQEHINNHEPDVKAEWTLHDDSKEARRN
ncbi:oxygenase MpaB family protein [Corynebacterium rhinophilum]|uniref:oxygenase MpaB family protein n=1 Tax=Corynebacterium rhinophilum TaxID=3050197 RepID=UPI00254CAE3B|nr:oxygenase MpaB family protein [Corynebacterium sp. MSK082]MDK8646585.1 oxygenase MpaB family protein [Corynebacterium sp. MSK082]